MIGSDAPQHDFLSNYMLREVMLKTVPTSVQARWHIQTHRPSTETESVPVLP
jgi:hypothetical protein